MPVMPDVTNRLSPIGGVIMPISMLTTMMMPRCTGSTPSSMAIGNTTGATISRRPEGSMNCPPISSRMFTAIRKVNQSKPAPSIMSVIACGMRSAVRTWAKSSALTMMNISITVVRDASTMTLRVSSLKKARPILRNESARLRPQTGRPAPRWPKTPITPVRSPRHSV